MQKNIFNWPKQIFVITLLLIWGCSTKVSKLANYNRYIKGYNINLYNDTLKLYFRSPTDINYFNTPSVIKKQLKNSLFKSKNEVLFYGTTKEPAYVLAVTIGDKKENKLANQFIRDTLIGRHTLHFMAILPDTNARRAVTGDLNQIVKSIKIGEGYADKNASVMDIVNDATNSNHFYQTLSEIQQFPIPKNQGNSLELQMQLTYSSFLINSDAYTKLLAENESTFNPVDSIVNVIKNNHINNDAALEAIVQQAKMKRLVMINENHFYPNHRLSIIALLPRLKAIGYNYLALEALASDSALNTPNAAPNLATGFYTREQNYGNLLRTAKALGFNFVNYEHTGANQDREIKQADNLYHKTFAKDSAAKVLVVAGIDHILEKPASNAKKWMAQLFFEKYHIDPLTISQTHLNLYRKFTTATYQLLNYNELKGIQKVANVDLLLLNNAKTDFTEGKAKFNYHNKNQETVQVSLFYQKELSNSSAYQLAVPYFTVLVNAKQQYKLPLPANEDVYLVVYNQLGQVLTREIIKRIDK